MSHEKLQRVIATTSISNRVALTLLVKEIEKGSDELDSLKEKHKQLLEIVKDDSLIKELREDIEHVSKLEGPRGESGNTPTRQELLALIKPLIPEPIRGEQGKDGRAGIDGKSPVVGVDFKFPKDGKDGKDGDAGKNAPKRKNRFETGGFWRGGGAHSRVQHGKTITDDATAEAGQILLVDASGRAITVTLPISSTTFKYNPIRIKKVDSTANKVTVATTASQKIDGALTAVIESQYESIDLSTDLSNWFIL